MNYAVYNLPIIAQKYVTAHWQADEFPDDMSNHSYANLNINNCPVEHAEHV